MAEMARTARRKAFDEALRSTEVTNAVSRASATAAARARRQFVLHNEQSSSLDNRATGSKVRQAALLHAGCQCRKWFASDRRSELVWCRVSHNSRRVSTARRYPSVGGATLSQIERSPTQTRRR